MRIIRFGAAGLAAIVLAGCGTTAATEKTRDTTTAESAAVTTATQAQDVTEALASKKAAHEVVASWDEADVVEVALSDSVDGTVTITDPGTYRLSGSLAGQVVVHSESDLPVQLILDGVDITSETGAAIAITAAEEVVVILADGSVNTLTDSVTYADTSTDAPNAALWSADDMTIAGTGSLIVTGRSNDGIASKDGLVIEAGGITVDAVDDGIRGKDYLVVEVTAQGDGLKSDNEEDATKGYISIEAGVFDVTAAGDAIQAQTDVTIGGGEFELAAGGGSGAEIDEATSAKGLKAGVNVVIEGGAFAIDSADDAVHSNGALTVNGGTFDIATGDDAMHAGSELTVNGGEIDITRSYEGIESAVITLNGGDLHVVSSDDGLNVAGGNDGSGMAGAGQPAPGGRPGRGGGPRQDASATSNQILRINGGRIVVEAGGDGIDINGAVEMTGGVLIVHGPTQNMNAALDYDRSFKMTGGYLIAVGSSGMAQAPDESSSQLSILVNLSSPLQSGALIHLQASDGTEIFTFEPAKAYQSIAFSSPDLVEGATYLLYGGGSSTGSAKDGLYEGGAYSPGSQLASLTLSGTVTRLGGRSRY